MTEEAGQTTHERVRRVETGSGPHFLQLPLPPDGEGHDDPHRQAAEETRDVGVAAVFSKDAALLLRVTPYQPEIAVPFIPADGLSLCASEDDGVRPLKPDQSLDRNQKCDEKQHGAICVAEKEQGAEGDDITRGVQVGWPRLQDAKGSQKNCGGREKKS